MLPHLQQSGTPRVKLPPEFCLDLADRLALLARGKIHMRSLGWPNPINNRTCSSSCFFKSTQSTHSLSLLTWWT